MINNVIPSLNTSPPGCPWTDEEKLLFSALRPCLTSAEISAVFKRLGSDRSEDAVGRRGRRVGIHFVGLGKPDAVELSAKQAEAVADVLETTRGLAELDELVDAREAEQDALDGLVNNSREVEFAPVKRLVSAAEIRIRLDEIRKDADIKSSLGVLPVRGKGTSLILMLSDLHFGKQTETFNIAVASERIVGIPEKIKSFLPPDLDEVIITLGGDIVEGEDVYPTQNAHVECPLIEQAHHATKAIWTMMVKFARQGYKVRAHTCPGNHGRMSKTANERTNWDNVVYQELGLLADISGVKDIAVEVNYEDFLRFPIRDKWGLLYHHGVKHTGTPSMQIRLAGWLHTKPWQVLIHGHWHQWEVGTLFGRPVVKNGSLPGPDDLAERMGVADPPRQAYFFAKNNEPLYAFSFLEWL